VPAAARVERLSRRGRSGLDHDPENRIMI
jgi:hypothetical protein